MPGVAAAATYELSSRSASVRSVKMNLGFWRFIVPPSQRFENNCRNIFTKFRLNKSFDGGIENPACEVGNDRLRAAG